MLCGIVGKMSCVYHMSNIPHEDAEMFIGYLANIAGMMMFSAPLLKIVSKYFRDSFFGSTLVLDGSHSTERRLGSSDMAEQFWNADMLFLGFLWLSHPQYICHIS